MISMDFKSIASAALSHGVGKSDIPLSSESTGMLNELIASGMFKDRSDFVQFAIKAYMQYKISGGAAQNTRSGILDIIQKTGIGKGANQSDIQDKLVPLLTEAFLAVGKNKMGL